MPSVKGDPKVDSAVLDIAQVLQREIETWKTRINLDQPTLREIKFALTISLAWVDRYLAIRELQRGGKRKDKDGRETTRV